MKAVKLPTRDFGKDILMYSRNGKFLEKKKNQFGSLLFEKSNIDKNDLIELLFFCTNTSESWYYRS